MRQVIEKLLIKFLETVKKKRIKSINYVETCKGCEVDLKTDEYSFCNKCLTKYISEYEKRSI